MVRTKTDFESALDLLVLKILARRGPMHGYGIAQQIESISEEALRVEEGSLYPALHRMEESGWIDAEWATGEGKRRARIYQLTVAGRRQLRAEEERWSRVSGGVSRILEFA